MGRLVINGEEVYELDEECLKEKNALPKNRKDAFGFWKERCMEEDKKENDCGVRPSR